VSLTADAFDARDGTRSGHARHLAAVSAPRKTLDRRAQSFVPVYTELFRSTRDVNGRVGYGLSGNVAVFFSVLIHLQGSPADGRRQSRSELDGKERFSARTLSAGELTRTYGWTYDEIQSWAENCSAPHACPHCERAHPLLQVERRTGHRNRYAIVRCQDLADDDCVPIALTARAKRVPTGAADPAARFLRDDPQATLPFDSPVTLGKSPKVTDAEPSRTIGQTPTVRTPLAAQSVAAGSSSAAQIEPETDLEARVMVLRGFAKLQAARIDSESLAAIATLVEEPEELLSTLIYVFASASISKIAITPAYVTEALLKRAAPQKTPEHETRGSEWATNRLLELARLREPSTSYAQARTMRDEIYARCLDHTDGGATEAEDELSRIVTDPRICGAHGKDAPKSAIAMIRDGLKKGWLWIPAQDDDGTGPLERAFERLSPGDQREVELIFRSSEGGVLNYARLNKHRIGSKSMIAYLRRRFSDTS
jgi:hypothetical protein